MNALETRLHDSLHDPALDSRAPTAEEVLDGLRAAIRDPEPPTTWWRRTRVLPVACAAVVTLAVVVGGALLVPRLTGDSPPTSSTSAPPAAPEGMRLVGIKGIAVAVPETWSTNHVSCGIPMGNTVVFEDDSHFLGFCPAPQRPAGVSAVRLVPASSFTGEHYSKRAEPAGEVDGVPIQRVPTTVDRGLATGAVVVPSENAVVFVDSPDPAVVDDLLATVSVLPDGYASLPVPRLFESVSRFSNRLHAAGFEVRTVMGERPTATSPGDVLTVEPDEGSVALVGSVVTVTVADETLPETPHEIELYHCGVSPTRFATREWMIPPRRQPFDIATAPESWVGTGTMRLHGKDQAVYTDDSGIQLWFQPSEGDHPPCF